MKIVCGSGSTSFRTGWAGALRRMLALVALVAVGGRGHRVPGPREVSTDLSEAAAGWRIRRAHWRKRFDICGITRCVRHAACVQLGL
jgi:hypothetical protein